MTSFAEFLRSKIAADGFSTEDTLASFLPLAREVLETHAAGFVAPLEGADDLQVQESRIWFEEANRRPARHVRAEIQRIERQSLANMEIVSEIRVTTDVFGESEDVVNLAIGDLSQSPNRPVYLPGYQTWEHLLGCHDPLTDIFSLGMILASLCCRLDFHDPDALVSFVTHRRDLFSISNHLHPVLARAIVRMTEVDRRQRAQDLASLVHALEYYRDQEVDFDFDLARSQEYSNRPQKDKQTVVLTKLRERLFEISRRNKLLHFRTTMQSVNLTQASVPLSFDIKKIRADQILRWTDGLQKRIASGKPVSLNKYLNFAEAIYLPSQLERLIAEAKRDQAEFGFAQLRLVIGFLHWANLKEKPVEQYDSPLILLPVVLKKKKGIRDTFFVEALTSEAELNPVVCHLFKQVYDIDLPATIDLTTTNLDDFYNLLAEKVQASDAAVTLTKVDRPRVEIIHAKARRKLDQYQRRAKLAGRGVRKFLDLDYSYDPANYHPLGVRLFNARIRSSPTQLKTIIDEKPSPRSFVTPDPDAPVVERERQLYALQGGGEVNPYEWTFDLCSVTLANFKYRRMSLVRDYETLLEEPVVNPAFDTAFSLAPRSLNEKPQDARPLKDRFDVVPCDPTQSRAIAEASLGKSYIIQGPPGTGKSQTITNLIADYVARGKRVLFVCEKRAAIDVVYARLRQCGLANLCCLVHDSQSDKKSFVMDLKRTYDGFLNKAKQEDSSSTDRPTLLQRLQENLDPIEQFDRLMQSEPAHIGIPIRQLINRCIGLRDALPELDPLDKEGLPEPFEWIQGLSTVKAFEQTLQETGDESVLAKHPLRILSPKLASEKHPLKLISGSVGKALERLGDIQKKFQDSGVAKDQWETLGKARALVEYVCRVAFVYDANQLHLFDSKHKETRWYAKRRNRLRKLEQELAQAITLNQHWQHKLSADETRIAIEQAAALKGSALAWLYPTWWRLRSMLGRCYDFNAHRVIPSWSDVLSQLQQEHEIVQSQQKNRLDIADRLDLEPEEINPFLEQMEKLKAWLPQQPSWILTTHAKLLKSESGPETIHKMTQAEPSLNELVLELEKISDSIESLSIADLQNSLHYVTENIGSLSDFLDVLLSLQSLPASVVQAVRTLPYGSQQIDAAVSDHGLEGVYRSEKRIKRFTAKTYRRHVSRLEKTYDRWLESNAAEIYDRVYQRFQNHLHVAEQPTGKLSSEDKEFKKRYNRGRCELEHEFGKQMRYKAIRDLVADESGDVVNDLKPVWLMSPLSVSDTLPLTADRFDVVIFDEASQITLEEAVPSLFRARQSIVVGDEMQLPPSDFFSAKRVEEEELMVESGGRQVHYDLDSGSFLSHVAKNLPSTMLGWHYRSRSESLISFSNWAFYDGRLMTVPEESLAGVERSPIVAVCAEDGVQGSKELLDRPISFHSLRHGIYEKRRNLAESEYIAEMVRSLLAKGSKKTIGIVAFSESQQDEISQAIGRLADEDKSFKARLDAEWEREDDGQFVGLLIKNLENIQGDERDIIIMSVCYGHPKQGKMRMNFGPINKSGGEKRLNVAFSRAKHHLAIVSSIVSTDITNDYNDGANCLKNYLRYGEAVSVGDGATAHSLLRGLSRWGHDQTKASGTVDATAEQLSVALVAAGYEVDSFVGQSHFRCDLAIYRQGDTAYRLGILIDNEAYYEQADFLERDMMRPRLLRAFGWRVLFILAKDWYTDPEGITQEVLEMLDES